VIGPATAALCELILERRPHPEQGFLCNDNCDVRAAKIRLAGLVNAGGGRRQGDDN
jgi:hypothetical protein